MMIHNNCSIIVICKILVFRVKMSEIEHRTDHMNSLARHFALTNPLSNIEQNFDSHKNA